MHKYTHEYIYRAGNGLRVIFFQPGAFYATASFQPGAIFQAYGRQSKNEPD
jgi:hypothetical protein